MKKRKTFNESFIDAYKDNNLSSYDLDTKAHVELSPSFAGAVESSKKIRDNMKDAFKEQDKLVKDFLSLQDLEENPKIKSRPELKAMKLSEAELSNKSREVNRKSLKESLSRGWTEDFHYLIDEFMPVRGEGDTMASQAVTAVNKLIYKFYNDGDVFDNTHTLEGWANDLSTYANWLYKFVPESAPALMGIEDCYTEEDYQELLQDLAAVVLDEKTLDRLADQPAVSSIYSQSGPFKFIDRDEEDDYYESLKLSDIKDDKLVESKDVEIPLSEGLNYSNVDEFIDIHVPLERLGLMAWKWMSKDDLIDMLKANGLGFDWEDEEDEDYYESLSLNEDYSNFIGRPLKDFLYNIDGRTTLNVDFENRDTTSGISGFSGLAQQLPWYTADKIVKDIQLGDERYYKFKVLTESKTLNESSVEDMIKAFENRIDELENDTNESLKESGNTFSIKDQVQRYIVTKLEEEINDITALEIARKISGYDLDWCSADVTPLNTRLQTQINYHISVIASALTKILFEDSPEEIKESLKEDLDPFKIHDFIDQFVSMDKLGEMAYKWMSNNELADMLDDNGYAHDDYLLEARRKNLLPADEKPRSYKIVASDTDDNIVFIKKVNGYNQIIKNLDIIKNDIPEGATQIYVTRDDDKEVYSAFVNDDGSLDVLEDNLIMEMDDGDRPSLLNKVQADLGTESAADVKALRELSREGKGQVGFDEHEIGFLNDTFHLNSRNMKQINWAKEVADHYGFKYSEVKTRMKDGEERYYIDVYAPGISNDPLLGES